MEQPTKMDKPKANPLDYVQKNYCKYDKVEKPLQELLEQNRSEKDIAITLGISLPTVHKYKNILALKNNKLYATQEERNFLEKQEKRAALAAASAPDASAFDEPAGEHSGLLPSSINFIAPETCDNVIETTAVPQEGTSPDSFKGGGTKPASEKQLTFISSLAQSEGKDPDELALEAFGKPVQELQGKQADALIKRMKK